MQSVYLIHFDSPYKHARHYLGWTSDLQARMETHWKGHGSRLVQVVLDAGIGVRLARVWEGQDRNFERKLKNRNNSPRLCPICRGLDNVVEITRKVQEPVAAVG